MVAYAFVPCTFVVVAARFCFEWLACNVVGGFSVRRLCIVAYRSLCSALVAECCLCVFFGGTILFCQKIGKIGLQSVLY